MQELIGRLSALDPEAENDVRVIAYFDALAESRAGLDGHIRGAAVLSGCSAGLMDVLGRAPLTDELIGATLKRRTARGTTSSWPGRRNSPLPELYPLRLVFLNGCGLANWRTSACNSRHSAPAGHCSVASCFQPFGLEEGGLPFRHS